MSIDLASENVITAQRILMTCALMAMICSLALLFTPRDER